MKPNIQITIILILMFVLTQLIGLAVVNFYLQEQNIVPYGMGPPKEAPSLCSSNENLFICFGMVFLQIFLFAAVIMLFLFLIKTKSVWFIRIWFFLVVVIALGITLNMIANTYFTQQNSIIFISLIAALLAYIKVFRKNIFIHNLTELMIYPGVAAALILIILYIFGNFSLPATMLLLVAISLYDIWAVWHSGVMQKMAKFQINKVGIFSGFFIPYASKKIRDKIKLLKLKYKNHIPQSVAKKSNLRINLAILGGGDVIFPIIAAGVFLKVFQSIFASLTVVLFATLSLLYLFIFAEKKKFYPAMPYITTGIFLGMLVGWLIFVL